MNQNPFATETFEDIWSKHFNKSLKTNKFNFIKNVSFANHKRYPLFYNVGNKLTNGNFYKISDSADDYKNKTFLIRDIPSYNKVIQSSRERLKTKSIFQYQGYTTQINNYESLDDYLKSIYKSNTRSKLRRNIKRLNSCFSVDYVMYFGEISENTYNIVFKIFYKLLEKRYADKGESCGELDPKLWAYYTELGLELIREKKASLFVIYCDKVPVGITFSYHTGDILIEALTVFDIDFYRFNIGHTTILKMLEWSFENKIRLFDYTQGDFEYKKRWSDSQYDTFHHVLYDSKSLKSNLLASFVTIYFNKKRKFRELKLNNFYHNLRHKILGDNKKLYKKPYNYRVEVINEHLSSNTERTKIDIFKVSHTALRRGLYDFLYMNPEPAKNITVFKFDDNTYYAQGETNTLKFVSDDK